MEDWAPAAVGQEVRHGDTDDDYSLNSTADPAAIMTMKQTRRPYMASVIAAGLLCLSLGFVSIFQPNEGLDLSLLSPWNRDDIYPTKTGFIGVRETAGIVPKPLLGSVYKTSDFVNQISRTPPFWECRGNSCNVSVVWGPCYAPKGRIHWTKEAVLSRERGGAPQYPAPEPEQTAGDLRGYCRPGFLIIGAGKCGTRYVTIIFIETTIAN